MVAASKWADTLKLLCLSLTILIQKQQEKKERGKIKRKHTQKNPASMTHTVYYEILYSALWVMKQSERAPGEGKEQVSKEK